MGFRLSFLFDFPSVISEVGKAESLNGQNLAMIALLRALVRRPEISVVELLVDIRLLADQAAIQGVASAILEPDLTGKGKLEILPSSYIPEIWGDGHERIIFSHDLITLVRDRQLRDRFAKGPSPLFWDTHNQPPGKLQLALSGAKGLKRVEYDRILCLSHCLMQGTQVLFDQLLPADGGGAPARLDYLPRSLDTSFFHPASDQNEKRRIRQQQGLPVEGTLAVHLSRLTPSAKADLAPLVESFAKQARPGEHLVIAGPENTPGYLAALAGVIPASMKGQIHLRGLVPPGERRDFLAACDFFAFPADFLMEGAGLAVVEALACGLPVVSSDLNGFREAIHHGVNGLKARTVILPGFERAEKLAGISSFFLDGIQQAQCVWIDHEEYMSHFWQMMRDGQFRDSCSKAAVELARRDYSLDSTLSSLVEMAEESLSAARNDKTGREANRAQAEAEGSPVLFWEIFRFGGTEEASGTSSVCLTEKGRFWLDGGESPAWYADLLPFVNKPFHQEVMKRISLGSCLMEEICLLGRPYGLSNSDVFYQVGLLLKQNCLAIGVSSA